MPKTSQHKTLREFKEAWHSLDKQTFNGHIDIPLIYLQLKRICRSLISSHFITPIEPSTTLATPIGDDNSKTHSIATNNYQLENCQPTRCSCRLKHRVESSKQ